MAPEWTDALIIGGSVLAPEGFGEIFDRHVDEVHGYLRRRAGAGAADGLVGEVFRIAFENRARYRTARDCALPWLYGIAANVLRQHARGEHRRHRLMAKLTSAASTVEVDDDGHQPGEPGVLAAVVHVLGRLPEAEREAVLLYAWEDLSYGEIAVAQGVPLGTVRSRLSRARRRIREQVGDGGQESGEPTVEPSGGATHE